MKILFPFIFFLFFINNLLAQAPKEEKNLTLESDTLGKIEEKLEAEDLVLNQELTPKKRKKKEKKRRREYLGLKTSFTSTQDEDKYELFRVVNIEHLPKYTHQKEIHYFDLENQKIKAEDYIALSKKLKKGRKIYLLHGNYQLVRDGELRAEGFYNKGLKHDEWFEYDKKGILLERLKYHEGFPKDSKITYFDDAQNKVKEIIPLVHGRKQGKYYRYFENGALAEEGILENNQKIRIWNEYFPNKQRQRQTEHPTHWYEEAKPKLLMEWDEKGKTLFDVNRGGKQN
jgi:antitoxin component YwqK of YwqJK toxin-antitoxin module